MTETKKRQLEAWRNVAEAMHGITVAVEGLIEAHAEAPQDQEDQEDQEGQGTGRREAPVAQALSDAEREEEAIKTQLARIVAEMEKAQDRSTLATLYREAKSVLGAAPRQLQGTWTQAWQRRIDNVSKKRAVEGGFTARGAA